MANIRCVNIRKSYGGHTVIEKLNLDIADQEFVVFLGPSGCGKSTMLRMIAGLEEITDGSVSIGDRDVTYLHPGERGVAMVFQSYALYPHMTVEQNIAFGLRRQKVSEDEITRRVRHVTGLLGLDSLLERKPKNLSGGQQQRVAMARAMIKTPKLFLFDEPLSNLDAKLREKLRTEIRKMHLELKTTTIFVTHDQLEAMTIADRIVLMRAGEIEQQGTPAEIFDRRQDRAYRRLRAAPGTYRRVWRTYAGDEDRGRAATVQDGARIARRSECHYRQDCFGGEHGQRRAGDRRRRRSGNVFRH
jgi:multiple sugar transport system ATP-binding protein